ncbi:MAG: hypothetical protein CM15mP121_0060 [Bacteroidota bacterium]|nr:MAG: hypothetical protein CM15mP121_0060 [Bacteroidota bacterium]
MDEMIFDLSDNMTVTEIIKLSNNIELSFYIKMIVYLLI